ncbi:MAG: triose-phosphate isomerase [Pontibacterium sp.]
MRTKYVIANWKMNGNLASNAELVNGLKETLVDENAATFAVCAPAPYLASTQALVEGSNIGLGSQDVSSQTSGAFTGEVSAPMLQEFGVTYALVGHSERRTLHGETSQYVAEKTQQAIAHDIVPVICIGETLEERQSDQIKAVLSEQLGAVISHCGVEALNKSVIAYEPVWAIGTGVSATPEQAQDTHALIRELIAEHSAEVAQSVSILYGGSVKPETAKELFDQDDIDGGLIGGASLKVADFTAICKAA